MVPVSRWLRRVVIRAWPLLAALAVLIGLPLLIARTERGRVAVEAAIYLPDMVLQVPMPVRPVELISEPPRRQRVTISYESRNGPRAIEADLYIPAHGTKRQAVVFSMGAPPLPLDDPRLVRIAEDAARSGVVMLVPFSDRLDANRIEPEEIDALVAEFQYVQRQPQVDPKRVGFFGASVGGSLALVAAGDPRIAADVQQVVSFGGYFDALATFGAIATHRIVSQGVNEPWTPQVHAEKVMAQQLIDGLDNPADRDLLTAMFIDDKPEAPAELATLSPFGRGSYDFLANRDPAAVQALIDRLPPDAVAAMNYLSPRTSIANVKAQLFILHDRADPYVPYTQSRELKAAVAGRKNVYFDELRLFQHVQPKLDQRPEIIAVDSTKLLFRLYQLMLSWQ
ncbi:MAG: acetylxylan esterase [Dehalococcoidia bacterium]|nr:acetylxylan esterase [Dehalococcoidia bacterium]